MGFVGSSGFVALIVGVVVLATVLPLALIFLKFRRRSLRQPVRGTLTVTSGSYPPAQATAANYQLAGVVSGQGVASVAVQKTGIARLSKWPTAGEVLPIEFEQGDPRVFNILWDEVPTAEFRGAAAAQALAQQMGGYGVGGKAGPSAAGTATVFSVVTQPGAEGSTVAQLGVQLRPDTAGPEVSTVLNIVFRPESAARRDALCRVGARIPVLFDPLQPTFAVPDVSRLPA